MKSLRWYRAGLFCTALLVSPQFLTAEPAPLLSIQRGTNGLPRLTFPMVGADAYAVWSATNVFGPYLPDNSGTQVGPSLQVTLPGGQRYYRVSATSIDSNEMLAGIVLNRLTYGPTPADIAHIRSIGPGAFISEQLAGETISDTLNTDPPITNAPIYVPPQQFTNWIRVSATGLVPSGGSITERTNFGIHFSGPGRVYLDDIRLVTGTNADVGDNLLLNGDFEDPMLFPPWIYGATNVTLALNTNQTVITNSPTVDGLAASGTNCLLLVASAGNNNLYSTFWQPFTSTPPPTNQPFTLSFSYLPVQNASNTTLSLRLNGSGLRQNINLPSIPATPPTPPPNPSAISPVYARLTNTVGSLEDLRAWHVYRAVHSPQQLHEILVQFFENHFNTQYQKTKDWFDMNFSGAITNDTVRQWLSVDMEFRENRLFRSKLLDPNCTFHDLLKISAESPAMVIYLDTVLSTKNAANENYARELMELFSMGADNGYIQPDIVDLAKIWTGWRVAKKDASVANNPLAPPLVDTTNAPGLWVLHFNTNQHNYTSTKRLFTNGTVDVRFGSQFRGGQPYSLIISNQAFPGTNGMREGYLVLEHLATLPYVMEFMSVKLCRVFIHENFQYGEYDYRTPATPEAQLIKDCMTAWDTPASDGRKGNLRSVLRVIFDSALFRSQSAAGQKVKTPLELAVSAVRALRLRDTDTNGWVSTTGDTDGYGISGQNNTSPLSRMGNMGLFNRAEPDGFSEFGSIWLNTANLCERMRFTQSFLMPTSGSTLKSSDYGTPGTRNVSDPVKLLRLQLPSVQWNDASAIVDLFLGLIYPGEGRGNLEIDRNAAINLLNTDDAGVSSPFTGLTGATYDGRVRTMVGFLLSVPRFQTQ
jgi:uncharacterized protein (DUF1800 family)